MFDTNTILPLSCVSRTDEAWGNFTSHLHFELIWHRNPKNSVLQLDPYVKGCDQKARRQSFYRIPSACAQWSHCDHSPHFLIRSRKFLLLLCKIKLRVMVMVLTVLYALQLIYAYFCWNSILKECHCKFKLLNWTWRSMLVAITTLSGYTVYIRLVNIAHCNLLWISHLLVQVSSTLLHK